MRNLATRLPMILLATTALFATACDNAGTANDPTTDQTTATGELAQMALTSDDESDDGFDESADPTPFLDEMPDAFDESEAPTATEEDGDDVLPADVEEPNVLRRTIRLVWGQPVFNASVPTATDWAGKVSVDAGVLRVLRKVRFEPNTDSLVPDGNPQTVSFTSMTKPHHDGLVLRIAIPRDKVEGATLTFETDVFTRTVAIANLLDGFHEVRRADDLGNIVRLDTVPDHPCDHGLAVGHWKRLDARGGAFGGRVMNDEGAAIGYWMGLWQKVDGKRRLKGVYLNNNKEFLGTLRGSWRPFPTEGGLTGGAFRAHWRKNDGEVQGIIVGTYTVGDEAGQGAVMGRWRKRCAANEGGPCTEEMTLPAPGTAACGCEPAAAGEAPTCSCEVPPVRTCLDAEGTASGAPGGAPSQAPAE